jgi:hypothetical protein
MTQSWLRQLDRWLKRVSPAIALLNPQLTPLQLQQALQQIIMAVLWLRLSEQRHLMTADQWRSLKHCYTIRSALQNRLQNLDQQYGFSGLLTSLVANINIENTALQTLMAWVEIYPIAGLTPELLGQVYEYTWQLFSTSAENHLDRAEFASKKSGGVYYTPKAIAEFMVQQTIDRYFADQPDESHAYPSLLDLACGSGACLLAAYRYLLANYLEWYLTRSGEREQTSLTSPLPLCRGVDGQWQLTPIERQHILLNCIYGVDIDPQAITVAKLALLFTWLEDQSVPSLQPLPDLRLNLHVGNALVGADFTERSLPPLQSLLSTFDWHLAFPKIAQAQGFDVLVGNPPYVDSEWMMACLPDWRTYCNHHYPAATGNWDLFCIFINRGLDLCKPGGWVSLVVPNKLASADYAAKVRSLLTHDNQLLVLCDYSRVALFAAAVYPLVFVVQKKVPDLQATIHYQSIESRTDQANNSSEREQSLSYLSFCSVPEDPWPLSSQSWLIELVTHWRRIFPPLSQIAQVTGAATVGEAYALQSLIQEKPAIADQDLRVINSGTIDRYCLQWGIKPLRYLGKQYLHPVVPRSLMASFPQPRQQQATQPKIIVAGMTKTLECALDSDGSVLAAKSTSVIRSTVALPYLLGLLNSRVLNAYFTLSYAGNRLQGGYLRVGPPQLKQLPIPELDLQQSGDRDHYDQLIEWVNQTLELHQRVQHNQGASLPHLNAQIQTLDRQIDRLVGKIYRLTEPEIEALIER